MNRTALFAVVLAIGTPALAGAANNTIGSATPSVLGEKHVQQIDAGDAAYYSYFLHQNRSYAAFCWVPTLAGLATGGGVCKVEFRNPSDVKVGKTIDGIPLAEPYPVTGTMAGFTVPTVPVSDPGGFFVRVQVFSSSAQTVGVIVLETTLAAPWYYVNTAYGYESYVEVLNHSNGLANAVVRAYREDGTIAASATLSIPPNGNRCLAVSAMGISLGTGSLTITSEAMPGTLIANVTTLSTLSGISFNAPFVTRMVWSVF
jgi:hypothetical protein